MPELSEDKKNMMEHFQKMKKSIDDKINKYDKKIEELYKEKETVQKRVDNTQEWIDEQLNKLDVKIAEVQKQIDNFIEKKSASINDWFVNMEKKLKEKSKKQKAQADESLEKFKK